MRSFINRNADYFRKVGEIVTACGIILGVVSLFIKPWAVQEISKDFVPRSEFNLCKDDTNRTLETVSLKLDKLGNDVSYIRGRIRDNYSSIDVEGNTRTAFRWKR